jgi:hypothetical protein
MSMKSIVGFFILCFLWCGAVSAQTVSTSPTPPCNQNAVVKLGDSRLAQEYAAQSSTQYTKQGSNFLTVANQLMGQRMQTQYLNFAVSGLRSDQYLAAQYTSQAFASNACWLLIYGIVNDIGATGATIDYWNVYIKPVVQQWIALPGRKVVLPTETGSTSIAGSTTNVGAVVKYNRQIKTFESLNPSQVFVADIAAVSMDPTQTMAWKAGFSQDGTHCNTMPCAFAQGQVIANTFISAGMPANPQMVITAGEVPTSNPLASTSSASTISGTTMVYGGTVTGQCLPGYIVSGAGISTFNATVVSGPVGGGAGSYTLSASFTISTPQTINCGPGPTQYFTNPLWLTTTGGATNAAINSGGAVPAGITAWTVPSGWSGTTSTASGIYGNDLTIAVTSTGSGSLVAWMGITGTFAYNYPGRQFFMNCEIDIASGATNFQSVTLLSQTGTDVNTSNAYDGFTNAASGFGNMPTPQTGLDLQTPAAVTFTGTSQTSLTGQLIFNFSGAGNATVKIRRCGFWNQQSMLEPANDNLMTKAA